MTHLHFTVDARGGTQHRFAVALEMDVHPHHGAVDLFLPVWTPGSYLVREHERHLGDMRSRSLPDGGELVCAKTAKNRFRCALGPSTRRVRIEYTVFAHELTVRTADLTDEHAFWNGVCLFLWPVGEREARATIDALLPTGWQLHTWLPTRTVADRVRVELHGIDEVADAPMLACPAARVLEFEVMGRPHRFVFDGLGSVEPPADLVPHTRAVIECAARVFELQALPYARYDFLTLVTDRGQGGLEHADGSVLLVPRTSLATGKGYRDFLGLVAHEHFHVFNVKRMRPADLWRLDYDGENYTELLWVAEGFTAYYDDLLCRRAGALSLAKYLQVLADNITDARRTPGRLVHPLASASYDAWIKFYRPDEDTKNSSQSYYVNGSLAALCLDLEIRRRTRGAHSLDDVMARLWRETYERGRGYTHDDVVAALGAAAQADLEQFVHALVRGPFDPDFAATLQPFGLEVVDAPASADAPPWLGVQLQAGSTVVAYVQRDSAAARAGIAAADEILAVADVRVTNSSFDEVVHAVARGHKRVAVLLARRGQILVRHVDLESVAPRASFRVEVSPQSTPEQDALRRGWLGTD